MLDITINVRYLVAEHAHNYADILTKGLARGPHRQQTLVLLGYRQLRWETDRGPLQQGQHKPEGV